MQKNKEKGNTSLKNICTLIGVLFAIAKISKQPTCPLMEEWEKFVALKYPIHWNIIQPFKRKKSYHLQLHGWTLKAFSEISHRKKFLYGFAYMWGPKKSPRKGDQTCGCQRRGVGGSREMGEGDQKEET